MEPACFFKNVDLNEEKSIILKWTGSDPGYLGCTYHFKGKDSKNPFNDYTVCVETKEVFLQSTGIRVKIKSGLGLDGYTVR